MDNKIERARNLSDIPPVTPPVGRGEKEVRSIGVDEPPQGSTSRPLVRTTRAMPWLQNAWAPASIAGLAAVGAWMYWRRDRPDSSRWNENL